MVSNSTKFHTSIAMKIVRLNIPYDAGMDNHEIKFLATPLALR